MHEGPHPLLVYLGLAVANRKELQDLMPLRTIGYSQQQLTEVIRGIQKYQSYTRQREHFELQKVWENETLTVVKPVGIKEPQDMIDTNPLLLVPSLINKAHIMDLAPERSLLRWLNENGVVAYLLDWGDLAADEENKTMSLAQLLRNKLVPAVERLARMHAEKIDLLGYCMGGTLIAGAWHMMRKDVGKIIFLATPWDFHASAQTNDTANDTANDTEQAVESTVSPPQELSEMVKNWAPVVLPVIKEKKCLPKEYTQSLFAALGAQSAVNKFIKFSGMRPAGAQADLFVKAEDWLNDGVDLPGRIAHECIQGWFLDNEPARGQWFVDDHCVNPAKFNAPCLIIAARKDALVSYPNACALHEQIAQEHRTLLAPDTGHVGLIVGKNAIRDVWQPLLEWLHASQSKA